MLHRPRNVQIYSAAAVVTTLKLPSYRRNTSNLTIVCSDNSRHRLRLLREQFYPSTALRSHHSSTPEGRQDVAGDTRGRGNVPPDVYKPRRAWPEKPQPRNYPQTCRCAGLPRVETGPGNGNETRVDTANCLLSSTVVYTLLLINFTLE